MKHLRAASEIILFATLSTGATRVPWLEWSREDRDDSGYKWRSIAELATERFAVHHEIWLEIHINSYIHDVIM